MSIVYLRSCSDVCIFQLARVAGGVVRELWALGIVGWFGWVCRPKAIGPKDFVCACVHSWVRSLERAHQRKAVQSWWLMEVVGIRAIRRVTLR